MSDIESIIDPLWSALSVVEEEIYLTRVHLSQYIFLNKFIIFYVILLSDKQV